MIAGAVVLLYTRRTSSYLGVAFANPAESQNLLSAYKQPGLFSSSKVHHLIYTL